MATVPARMATRLRNGGGAPRAGRCFFFGLIEVYSFTGIVNVRSEAVMRRLGMQRCPNKDFVYPDNTPCVVYRATPQTHKLGSAEEPLQATD